MDEDKRKKLIALGPEQLADALLELVERTEEAETVVERITSSGDEIARRFKAKISGLKRSNRFVDWRGAQSLAARLDDMLSDLESADPDTTKGVELVAAFYRCDASVFERCDDSSGFVGDVFQHRCQV